MLDSAAGEARAVLSLCFGSTRPKPLLGCPAGNGRGIPRGDAFAAAIGAAGELVGGGEDRVGSSCSFVRALFA